MIVSCTCTLFLVKDAFFLLMRFGEDGSSFMDLGVLLLIGQLANLYGGPVGHGDHPAILNTGNHSVVVVGRDREGSPLATGYTCP